MFDKLLAGTLKTGFRGLKAVHWGLRGSLVRRMATTSLLGGLGAATIGAPGSSLETRFGAFVGGATLGALAGAASFLPLRKMAWGATKSGISTGMYATGSLAKSAYGLARRHPGPLLLGAGAYGLYSFASPFVGGLSGGDRLDLMASYDPETLQREAQGIIQTGGGQWAGQSFSEMSGYVPVGAGVIRGGPQYVAPSMTDSFTQSTYGLVQGLHKGAMS